MRFLIVAGLLAVVQPPVACADLILDQAYEGPGTTALALNVGIQLAQTFTPSMTGTIAGFDFRLQKFGTLGDIFWDIRAASGTPQFLNSPVLASGTIDGTSVADGASWIQVRGFSVATIASDDLAIVLRGGSGGGWQLGQPGSYADGAAFGRNDESDPWTPQAGDLLFRTYAVTAVPEPASFLLFAMAGLSYFGYRRSRQFTAI